MEVIEGIKNTQIITTVPPPLPQPPNFTRFEYIVKEAATQTFNLESDQIQNVQHILNAWKEHGDGDTNKLLYIIATARHESRLRTVRECFATTDQAARYCVRNRSYSSVINGQVYYGRGFVQLTWLSNYKKMSDIFGVDFVNNPDFVLYPAHAANILVYGMINGSFTGKKLTTYINSNKRDYYNARRTVNGTDKATLIKNYTSSLIQNYNTFAAA